MALMKWGKYEHIQNTIYTNDRTVGAVSLGRWPHDGPTITGDGGYTFDSSWGYSSTGQVTTYDYVYYVQSTSVHIDFVTKIGEDYFVERFTHSECDIEYTHEKGAFIEEVVAEAGTYPSNSYLGSYWYVLIGASFPDLKPKVNNALKTSVSGTVKVEDNLRNILEMWTKAENVLKKIT